MPNYSGIYFVYESKYNALEKTIKPNKILYIGAAQDIREELSHTKKFDLWKSNLKAGSELCFATANVSKEIIYRVHAAYLVEHKPICNHFTEFIFEHDFTTLITLGKVGLIEPLISMSNSRTDDVYVNYSQNIG